MLKRPPLEKSVMGNVWFDSCVYHQPGINRSRVYELNARCVYPRLDVLL